MYTHVDADADADRDALPHADANTEPDMDAQADWRRNAGAGGEEYVRSPLSCQRSRAAFS